MGWSRGSQVMSTIIGQLKTHMPDVEARKIVYEILIEEFEYRQIERVHSIVAGVSLGAVAAMVAMIVADGGRLYLMMMGG